LTSFGRQRRISEISSYWFETSWACHEASSKVIIVSSIVSDNEVLPAMTNDCDKIPKLLKWIEESDARQVVRME